MNGQQIGTVAFALCGSFCTFGAAVPQAARPGKAGDRWDVVDAREMLIAGSTLTQPLSARAHQLTPTGTTSSRGHGIPPLRSVSPIPQPSLLSPGSSGARSPS